jgi:protein TonB
MKADFIVSVAAAVCLHAAVFVYLDGEIPAEPSAIADNSAAFNTSFIDLPPAPAPPAPAMDSEPPPLPAAPQPAVEASPPPADLPPPLLSSIPGKPILPAVELPVHLKTTPRTRRAKTPHSGPGSAASLARSAIGPSAGGAPGLPARGLRNPAPVYPDEARRMRQEGVVMLEVLVSSGGSAEEVTVIRSSGYALLDRAAAEAVRQWTFQPARTAGLPVACRVQIPVRFSLAN